MQQSAMGSGSSRALSFITESIRERARALGRAGKHSAAATEYQVLTDVAPTDVAAGMALAYHLTEAEHFERAGDELLRVAAIYAHQGHGRRATTVTLRALELAPGRVVRSRLVPIVSRLGLKAAELCEQIAWVHLLSERREAARDVLGLLVEADPTELRRRLRLAELDLSLGRTDEALLGLRIAADGLRARGRTTELVRVLEMMHAHGGPDAAVLRELSSIYVRCGQPRRALDKLRVLHRVAPDDRVALERLARMHALLGRLELTLRLVEELVGLIAKQADRSELRAALRRAASWASDPSYQHALESLGMRALRGQPMAAQQSAAAASRARSRRFRTPPPPLPRGVRARQASGEIHVLDPDTDAELIPDHAAPMPDHTALLVAAE